MKTHIVGFIEVSCLHNLEEAIEYSCEVSKHYGSNVMDSDDHLIVTEGTFSIQNLNSTNFPPDDIGLLMTKHRVNLKPYAGKIVEFKDFYKALTDRLLYVEIGLDDFNLLLGLIQSTDSEYPPRLCELVASIHDTLLNAGSDYLYGFKVFSLKDEIIVFMDYPMMKLVKETFFTKMGKAIESYGFFLKRPSYCIRFKAAKPKKV